MNESLIKQLFASAIYQSVECGNADKQSILHRTCFAFKMRGKCLHDIKMQDLETVFLFLF